MNKEIIEEKAMLYAFGTLPEADLEEFEALIRADREVQDIVHKSQLLNELDASECRVVEPPFQIYSKIMTQIDASKGTNAELTAAKSESSSKLIPFITWGGWAAAACATVLFGASLFNQPMPSETLASVTEEASFNVSPGSDIILNNLANPRLVAVSLPNEEFGIEDRMLELTSLAEAYWFSREGIPSDQLLEDESTDVAEVSGGFTIYDRKYQIGYIAVENLPEERDGKSYHVWAKTRKGQPPVRAGSLPVGADSKGLFFFDLSSVPGVASLDQINFFVTEERTESPKSPTGMVVLSNYLR